MKKWQLTLCSLCFCFVPSFLLLLPMIHAKITLDIGWLPIIIQSVICIFGLAGSAWIYKENKSYLKES